MVSTRIGSLFIICCVFLTKHMSLALPVLKQLPKRQIVTRMHTASTTNTVTDFYSTTTEIEVAPTVEFIVSGDQTFTTTLPRADGSTPTGSPLTTIVISASVNRQIGIASQPSSECATTIKTGTPRGTLTVSAFQTSEGSSSGNSNNQKQSSNQPASVAALTEIQSISDNTASPGAQDNALSTSALVSSPGSAISSNSEQATSAPGAVQVSSLATSGPTVTSVASSNEDGTFESSEQIASTFSTAQSLVPALSSPAASSPTTSSPATSSPATSSPATSSPATSSTTTLSPVTSPTTTSSSTTSSSTTSSSTTSTLVSTSSAASSSGDLTCAPTALAYSPYNNDNSCKDSDSVYKDLSLIKSRGVSQIRLYGTDCNSLETVTSAAKSLGLTINQGLWISPSGVDSIDDAVKDIISYGQSNGWDVFDILTIGNEAILSGYCSVSDLLAKISSVRTKFEGAGFGGRFTTSEPPVTFQNNPELCTKADIDFVGINSHPYFDVNSSADSAGTFVKGQLEMIQELCGTQNVVVTETGYPSAGIQNGGNHPSIENQIKAVQNILNEMNQDVTVLSTYNDYWKDAGSYGIEQSFGIIQLLPSA
ncbi:LAQU0S07e03774g1_1 [Lachancea quebecensis]|uniref:LAQU0S07e03774g1_1 n=1 Tax=Lachancea quebecensis TaxID=1654605 RepID=A0A0N7MLQ5_9SACH|nr:LAQU0S07e03774g1_1 [Lachancea quebecensis]